MLPLVIKVEQVDGGTRCYAFADSPVSIGRSPFTELQLSEPFISRWEGTLRFDADEITYFSLGSTNATYLNGEPLAQCEDDVPLGVDSVLTLGDLELRFSREPVPESDLRRKGKRRPTRENTASGHKTQYLDANVLVGRKPALAPNAPLAPSAAAAAFRETRVQPFAVVAAKRAAAIAPQSCIVLGDGALEQPRVTSAPPPAGSAEHSAAAAGDPLFAPERLATPERLAAPGAAGAVPLGAGSFNALRDTYHEARAALLVDIRAQLDASQEAERAEFLAWLIRREPTLASDPEMQLELERAGVLPPSEIPQLRDWLRAISPEIAPEGMPFDSQLALTRVLGLLEVLTQSLAEIHDAQESVRRRWLGRGARRSVLQSDDGNVVLAYLLNPQADWNDRLRELEQSVRDVVTHELALFRATLDGARTLVNTLSPNLIASKAAADSGDAARAAPAPGFWTRLLCKDAADIGLWRRFLSMYGELTDGARYERIFLGRVFSRSYLAAMGRPDPAGG
jgi:predicted component of type VI protein secretion system